MVGVDLPGVVALGQNLLEKLSDVGYSAHAVHWERENFLQLGDFLKDIVPVVVEINKTRDSSPVVLQVLEALYKDVENANQLIKICTSKSRIYLLTHCRSVVRQLENVTHSIGRTLSLLPLSAVQGHVEAKKLIDKLAQDMQEAHYYVQETDERICRTLEQDKDIRTDIAVQTGIVMDMARTLGMEDLPRNPTAMKDQMEMLRHDTHGTGESYDVHMVDVIGSIFENLAQTTDHPSPSPGTQQRLHSRLEPLYEAFVCPLTKQVMLDPVTLENGQTYERSAIERWFKQCRHDGRPAICPMTGKKLESMALKPSIALRNTIEEWTQRNESTRIMNARVLIETSTSYEEDLLYALEDLQALCVRNKMNKYKIRRNDLIPPIVGLLSSPREPVRLRSLALLRILAEDDEDNKEAIGQADALRSILKCVSRNVSEEREEAAALLYELSKSDSLCERIGSTNGAILYLVGMTSGYSDNVVAVQKAEMTLENMERLDQNVRQMAESGRIRPLLRRLIEGSEDVRYEMASDLATIALSAEVKALVAQEAAGVLVDMLANPNTQTREVALKALRALSTLESNGKLLIEAGILPPLMRDLFMVGASQVPMRMKEVCAAVLANVVSTTGEWQTTPLDAQGNTLISEQIVHNLLHLISNTGPAIEATLLRVLVGLASSPHAVANLVSYIKSAGGMVTLIQFLEASQEQLRVPAIRLLHLLSTHMGHDLADGLRVTTRQLGTLVKILSSSSSLIEEQAAAAGLLANLPVEDFRLTRALFEEGAIPILVKRIEELRNNVVRIGAARFMNTLQEGLVTILARFTFTLDDKEVVHLAKQYDLAVLFRTLLQTSNLDEVQHQSAVALENLSTLTPQCRPTVPPKASRRTWGLADFFPCVKVESGPSGLCPVHGMKCSPSETFCIVEAQAILPLVSCLDHSNVMIVEAALGALSTILQDNVDMQRGVQVLHANDAIQPILVILQEHRTEMLRQKSIWMVERILRNGDLARLISGDPHVHTAMVDALRHGNAVSRAMAEKSLKHLNKIPNFSGVFHKLGPPKQRPPGQ